MENVRFTCALSAATLLLLAGSAQGDTVTIKTTYGRGADTWVSEVGDTGNGADVRLLGRRSSSSQSWAALLRFDLSQIVPGSITSASINGYSYHTDTGNCGAIVFGLRDDAPNQLWDESTTKASTAPGLTYDGAYSTPMYSPVPATATNFGTWSVGTQTAGATNKAFSVQALVDWLNTDTDGLATAIIFGTGTATFQYTSKESTNRDDTLTVTGPAGTWAPWLTLTATLKAATTPALASSLNPSAVGSNVTFTATVQTNGVAAGDATGTVVFKEGATALSTNTVMSGVAAYTNNTLTVGSHTITAEYSGDANYLPSTNGVIQLVNVAGAATTTALVSSPNPSLLNSNVTFTATVKTNGTTASGASGSVIFKDAGTPLSTNTVTSGVAAYTNNILSPGSHTITAEYSGDTNYANSFSTTVTQMVQAATTLGLTPSSNPSTVSNNVTFTAAVQTNGATAGGAGGTVVFLDRGMPLSTNNVTGGVATYTNNFLAVGSHSLTAEYSGDGYYLPSTNFPALAQVIKPQIMIKTLFARGADTWVSEVGDTGNGSDVRLLGRRNSTGSQNWAILLRFDLSQIVPGSIASASVNGYSWHNDSSTGVRVFALRDDAAGQLWDESTTTASTAPGLSYDGSYSTELYNPVPATVTDLGTWTSGTQTAGAVKTFPSSQALVDWLNTDTDGVVTLLFCGTGSVTFQYASKEATQRDDTQAQGSSPAGTWAPWLVLGADIRAVATTTALASSGSPTPFGSNVTFTATVQTNGFTVGNAGGTVAFNSATSGLGIVNVTNGVASLSTSALGLGTNLVTAVYIGDSNYLGSTSLVVTQFVQMPVSVVVSLNSGSNPSLDGDYLIFQFEVNTNGTLAADAGGTVDIYDGATLVFGGAPLTSGSTAWGWNMANPGWHYITARYSGDGLYLTGTSSVPYAQAVYSASQTPTTMTLASSANPSTNGDSISLTATVSTNSVDPAVGAGGTVIFKDGAVTLGSRPVSGGQASLTTSPLATGVHALTAEYSGNATYGPSPAALSQTVQVPTTLALGSLANPSAQGVNVTFTATVQTSGATATAATGTVAFYDAGSPLAGTPNVVNGVASLTINSLALGSHDITAQYSGDALSSQVYPAASSAVLVQVVERGTTMTLVSSLNPSTNGNSVNFTATVRTNGVTVPDASGEIVFKDGGTALSTNSVAGGQAAFSTSALSVGSHPMTAEYSGDALYLGSVLATLTQVVQSSMPARGTNLSYSVNGGTLTVSWPGYLGWILQGQTNGLGIRTNSAYWADMPGTAGVTSTNLPLNAANPAVFYRLRHP